MAQAARGPLTRSRDVIRIPEALEQAIGREIRSLDRRRLARLTAALERRYLEGVGGSGPIVRGPDEVLAHAAHAMPACHARLVGSLRMVPLRAGRWLPATLLDLGAGPGTAAWAAADTWPGLSRVVAVEREPEFIALGRRLAQACPWPAVREASWIRQDLANAALPKERFDLVVLGHSLGEMPEAARDRLLHAAWEACGGVLVVVEPGTPAGFAAVRSARELLSRAGASTLAPCPHDASCPLVGDWCHFGERAERPDFQRRAKRASLPWEDVKWSFAALARFPSGAVPAARVIRRPLRLAGRIELVTCTPEGVGQVAVARSWPSYRRAKSLEWGSALEGGEQLGPAETLQGRDEVPGQR